MKFRQLVAKWHPFLSGRLKEWTFWTSTGNYKAVWYVYSCPVWIFWSETGSLRRKRNRILSGWGNFMFWSLVPEIWHGNKIFHFWLYCPVLKRPSLLNGRIGFWFATFIAAGNVYFPESWGLVIVALQKITNGLDNWGVADLCQAWHFFPFHKRWRFSTWLEWVTQCQAIVGGMWWTRNEDFHRIGTGACLPPAIASVVSRNHEVTVSIQLVLGYVVVCYHVETPIY